MFTTVRARVTMIAIVVTLGAMVGAALALSLVLRDSLLDEIDATITNRAFDVADAIDLTDELSNASFPTDGETFIGVIEFTETGELLEIHNDTRPEVGEFFDVLDNTAPDWGEPVDGSLSSLSSIIGDDSNLRIVFVPVETGDEIVVVARSLDGVDRTLATVRNGSFLAVPLLALLVGLLVWRLTGRALRPVELIRQEVESITETDLSKRVAEGDRDDEVGRLARTMNSMLERLDAGQERQRRFASDAAHELRSPLTSIAAQLDVDRLHPETTDVDRTTRVLREQISRLQRLVDDLLFLARYEEGGIDRVDLVDLDDLILDETRSLPNPNSVGIDLTGVSGAGVRGNEDHLRRLVRNVIANAIRHATGEVRVSTRISPDSAFVEVDDDGAGIAPEDRDRIFERFVRLDEARSRESGGSGLGLALAREVAQQHGGRLTVGESPAGGARFVIELPAAVHLR